MAALDVAKWMLEQLKEKKRLYQETAVYQIRKLFGEEYSYRNENGNFAISKEVLNEFRKMSEAIAIWERGERAWRLRRDSDKPGRQQE